MPTATPPDNSLPATSQTKDNALPSADGSGKGKRAPQKRPAIKKPKTAQRPPVLAVASLIEARDLRVAAVLDPLDDLINDFEIRSILVRRADGKTQRELDYEFCLAGFSDYTPSPELTADVDAVEFRGVSEMQVKQLVRAFGFERLPVTKAELYGLLAFGRRLSYLARQLHRLPQTQATVATEGLLLAAAALREARPMGVLKANLTSGTTLESEASRWMSQGGGDHTYVLNRIQGSLSPLDALKADRTALREFLIQAVQKERPLGQFVPGYWPFMSEPVFAPFRAIPYNFVPNYNYPRQKIKTSLGGALIGELSTCRYFGDAKTAFYKHGFYLHRPWAHDKPWDHPDEACGQESIRVSLNHPKIREVIAKAGYDFMDWVAQAVLFAHEIVPGSEPDDLGHCREEPDVQFWIPIGDYPEHNLHSRRYKAWLARLEAAGEGPPQTLSEIERRAWFDRASDAAMKKTWLDNGIVMGEMGDRK